ncbi:hypothetical protein ACEK07_64655 [Alcanivoracaceae bacterium MT1]|nr:hypothetical protein A3Q32_04115 [Alcanivorax sp. KX64203]
MASFLQGSWPDDAGDGHYRRWPDTGGRTDPEDHCPILRSTMLTSATEYGYRDGYKMGADKDKKNRKNPTGMIGFLNRCAPSWEKTGKEGVSNGG